MSTSFASDGFAMFRQFHSCAQLDVLAEFVHQFPEGRADSGLPSFPGDTQLQLATCLESLMSTPMLYIDWKMIDERAVEVGGSWPWHQDYWYDYQRGFLFPDMVSCLLALHPVTSENERLQVVRGSHRLGRLDHVLMDESGQSMYPSELEQKVRKLPIWIGAQPARVAEITERLDVVDCQMDPGDLLVLHGNCLHRSGYSTRSTEPPSLICCTFSATWNRAVTATDKSR